MSSRSRQTNSASLTTHLRRSLCVHHTSSAKLPNSPKRGFVILIAVLVASLLISLGAFIAHIALKELSLSISGRDSQLAFYAADAAIECALYQDLRTLSFPITATSSGAISVWCNSTSTPVVINSSLTNDNQAVSSFEVSFPRALGDDPDFSPYAKVRIIKRDIGGPNDETIIASRGYNIRTTTTPNRVERALEVRY